MGGDWRKSSYSNSFSNCVEVREDAGAVEVRDSKDPGGPVLSFTREAWAGFTASLRCGAP